MLKQLKIYYLFVALPFVTLIVGATLFRDAIMSTLDRNPHPQINYTIFVIILAGGFIILLNSRRLVREAKALVAFTQALRAKMDSTSLKTLANSFKCDIACLLQIIASSADRAISHQEQAALEHELANVHSRLNRRNALPSYLTGLLVGMGLLGTFIGLLATLGDIGALIGSFSDLDMSAADPIVVFSNMIEKMKAPMQSMAIAFSASMFGLLGSIILGLMMVGIRRLQGDIFSVLSSEVARHIEIALSFESISFRDPEAIGVAGETGEFTAKILLRIEERLAETARLRQRALSTEIDDFKQQRAEMLQALNQQTEASNNFRSEMQKLGAQLGALFSSMEQRNSEISSQISELTVSLGGGTKETNRLLASQVEEQKRLLDTLGSYNIEERLSEVFQAQQRSLAPVVEDFKKQREEMMQTVAGQGEASRDLRVELQQFGQQIGTLFKSLEQGTGEISSQLSELTVHLGADAKETHRLLNVTSSNVRSELQQLGKQIDAQKSSLEQGSEALHKVAERGAGFVGKKISELMTQLDSGSSKSNDSLFSVSNELRGELQSLGEQLSAIFQAFEKGSSDLGGQITQLMHHRHSDAKESRDLLARLLESQKMQVVGE